MNIILHAAYRLDLKLRLCQYEILFDLLPKVYQQIFTRNIGTYPVTKIVNKHSVINLNLGSTDPVVRMWKLFDVKSMSSRRLALDQWNKCQGVQILRNIS